MAEFDKEYWEDHWSPSAAATGQHVPVNPYLPAETMHLPAGTALDAGCGTGTEALWLARQKWRVTAVDIASAALSTARARAAHAGLPAPIEWVEADLSRWEPERRWDLVFTAYAHADVGQRALYRRLSSWVAPGGTLLIVGHRHAHHRDDHSGEEHPGDATTTLADVTSLLARSEWRIDAAYENTRVVRPGGHAIHLRDMILRARRLASPPPSLRRELIRRCAALPPSAPRMRLPSP